jgi:hypothetical protein
VGILRRVLEIFLKQCNISISFKPQSTSSTPMSFSRAIVYCQQCDSLESGKIAAQQIQSKLGCIPDILLLFTTIEHDVTLLLEGIRSVLGDVPISGCSGLGMITADGCDEASHSIALMGLQSDTVRFYPLLEEGVDSQLVGEAIGEKVKHLTLDAAEEKLLFLFPDPLTIDISKVLGAINEVCGEIDVVGGGAGNNYQAEYTEQFCHRTVTKQGVSGLLMVGQFKYHIGISHGAQPFGSFKTITRAEGSTIYEIDHQPASNLLETLIGEGRIHDVEQLINSIAFGIPFEEQGYSENTLLRCPLQLDIDQQSIVTTAAIPTGMAIQLVRRNPNRVLQATQAMAEKLLESVVNPDQALYFYFDCDGRGSYLFGEPEPDVEALQEVLGTTKDLIGFFCFSELAPVNGKNQSHALTGVLIVLEELEIRK